MSGALPRATCHECGGWVPVRVDGELRQHRRFDELDEAKRVECPASGKPARRAAEIRVHPVAAWFPMLDDDELRHLADDIAEHGLIEPVVVRDGVLLDGRNRLAACQLAGIEPETREWEGDESQVTAWIISRNLHRRHLTTSQRALIAARVAERPADGSGHDPGKFAGVPTQAEAAALLNVSERSVRDARAVLERGVPELVAQVEAGEVAVSRAAEQVRPPRDAWFPPQRGPDPFVESSPHDEPAPADPGAPSDDDHDELTIVSDDALTDIGQRAAVDQALARTDATRLCGAPHPEDGTPCTEPAGHVWTHAYSVDGRRVPWKNNGPELSTAPSVRLPNDERAEFDAYWTPDHVALACLRWLLGRVDLGEEFAAVEPAVGNAGWVRALRELRPKAIVDRFDLDPNAPGLHGLAEKGGPRRGVEIGRAQDWLAGVGGRYALRVSWDLCVGNRPYNLPIAPWVDLCLERARVTALLERQTITGDNIEQGRMDWWLAHRPAWIAAVEPRPKWQGPGARRQSDQVGSVLVVWVRGVTDTRWDWIDCRGGRP